MKAFFWVRPLPALAAAVLGITSVRCASSPDADDGSGGTVSSGSGGRTGTIIDIVGIGWTGGTSGSLDELDPRCGEALCSPDDPSACEPFGQGGAGGEGGAAAEFGGMGGLSADPGDLDEVEASCQVSLVEPGCEGGDCEREASCLPTGTQVADASCLSPEDCGPGLACIDLGATVGVCKPYCCAGSSSCGADSYCSSARLLGSDDLEVPVCAPLDDCSLLEPFPCSADGECACTGELACAVVRPDGRTACVRPGAGAEGDACSGLTSGDCGHGLVCSPTLGCMEICQTAGAEMTCTSDQLCQSPSGFPTALGVCVGPAPTR